MGKFRAGFGGFRGGRCPPGTPWDLAHSALKNCIYKTGSGSMSTAGRRKGATLGSDSSRRVSARENCTRGRFRPLKHSPPHTHRSPVSSHAGLNRAQGGVPVGILRVPARV